MMRWVCLLAGLVACSASSEGTSTSVTALSFAAEPLTTLSSTSGALRIAVRTAPAQPPSRGVQSVELVVSDGVTGAAEAGLALTVLPWMPAMGHGASLTPTVQEGPPGTYVVGNVDFFMPGTWELRTTLSGAITDYVAPSFQIP
jgi:hypothetical protein